MLQANYSPFRISLSVEVQLPDGMVRVQFGLCLLVDGLHHYHEHTPSRYQHKSVIALTACALPCLSHHIKVITHLLYADGAYSCKCVPS